MSQSGRSKFRARLNQLFRTVPDIDRTDSLASIELAANWAKYLCVLCSGYLEQSIKEIILTYATNTSPAIARYVDKTWPKSKNMNAGAIINILESCDKEWGAAITAWLSSDETRKSQINSIVNWRNEIAHGNDANTTGVTMHSISQAWKVIQAVVEKIEGIVGT